ncbi:MAG: hypothetical protein KGY60_00925 [Bacteroidales bacterium]|nr:hypothetical protein [Bacteroidales bacterium]
MSRLIILSLLLAVITYFNHAGTDKTPLREPSLIKLSMHLTQTRANPAASSQDLSRITFQNGILSLSSVEFLGSPHNTTDFHFTSSLHSQYQLQPEKSPLPLLEFDVPAGRYRSAKIILHANSRDSLPAMTVHARWQKKDGPKPIDIHIRLFDLPRILSLEVKPEGKERSLMFPRQGFSNLQIRIDPMQLFDPAVMDQLQEAKMQDTPTGRKVILSRHHNPHIHDRLTENMHESIRAVLQR